ncbi:MAG TPA: hypothetical protein VFV73_28445 [Streptosporangiaceae bacterium]|nr:hypothetical protein [Streptosporangiaceae bacterium]
MDRGVLAQWHPARLHRDERGFIRVSAPEGPTGPTSSGATRPC